MSYRTVDEKAGGKLTQYELLMQKVSALTRVAMPAIIKSIDYSRMVVSAQPCIKEKIAKGDGTYEDVTLPIIEDIPIVYPLSGTFAIFFPLQLEDECLLIFADTCIDSWWQSGGIQTQFENRRHDLSDCFCIPSQMSQPERLLSYSETSMQIKCRQTGMKVEIFPDRVEVAGVNIAQLKQDFDALKLEYDSHKHNTTVSGTSYTSTIPL